MSTTTTDAELTPDLVDRVRKLSPEGRGKLVALIDELDDRPADDPAEVNAAWKGEIARRIQDIADGKVVMPDGKQATEAMRERLRARHGA